jgi:hypothetical protein
MQAAYWLCVLLLAIADQNPEIRSDTRSGPAISDARTDADAPPTYAKHVAPILFRRCVTCHRPGEVAPFSLTSYETTVKWAETIREVVEQRRMPPWLANPAHGSFANEARLSEDELATIIGWIDSGTLEGDRSDLPPLPKFTDGWRIPEPDLVLEMPASFTIPAKGTVNYQYFTIDPGFTEDKWVRAAEARPANRAVVHHIVLLVQAPGDRPVRETGGLGSELLATFAPGLPPTVFSDGMAKLVPAGSKLVLQVHYTPNGTEQTDRSKVGLVFADPRSVRKQVRGAFALNFQFRIPPGASNHRVEAEHKFAQDTLLVSLFPHMHLRGKSFQFEAAYPDGRREILLDVPRWDFSWQNQYVLSQPKLIPEGTVLRCAAHFDNSADNPANPNPNTAVMFGEQTWQEMMVGYFDATLADQDLTAGAPVVKKVLALAGEPAAPPTRCTAIDLQAKANHELSKDFVEFLNGNNLAELPKGDQVFLGIPFRIGPQMICLGSPVKPERPERVQGVKVGTTLAKLHILQATEFGEGAPGTDRHVPDGAKIGEYTIHYEDGTKHEIPIVYGVDVRDWWFNDRSKSPTRGKVAWKGTNAYSSQLGSKIRLYLTTWQNPQPGVPVTHIDYSSSGTAAAPFCVALSAEMD